jgi:hypothetical protein
MRDTLKVAYDVRSKYLHGAVSKKLPYDKLLALFRLVAEYARVSCLIWTQAHAVGKHNDFSKMLEEALIDHDAHARLQEWCNGIGFAKKT